jgi:hypothetical protein
MSIEKNVQVVKNFVKSTNKAFKDDWVFDITVRNGKVMKRSGRGLAAGRHVPRARGIGRGAAEGFRRDRDDLSGAPGICGAGRTGSGRRRRYGESQVHE